MSGSRWWCIVPLLAFVVFTAVMVGPTLTGDRVFAATDLLERQAPWAETSTLAGPAVNLCVGDTVDNVFPSALEARGRLLEGDWPRWNDETLGGAPLAETPLHGVLSPIILGTLFLPLPLFPGWAKVLELAVLLGGCVLLGRRLGLGAGPSTFAALAFATSGFAVMWTNWPQARTIAFFPLVLWAVERVLQERNLRSAWPLPLVAAGTVLGGFPALVVYLVYLVIAWVAVRLVGTGRSAGLREALRALLVLAAAGVVTVALLAAQLVAMATWLLEADLGQRSTIPSGVDLEPTSASSVLFPRALGTCAENVPFWGGVSPVESVAFVGVGVLFLAMLTLVLPWPGQRLGRGLVLVLWATAVTTFAATFVGSPFADLLAALPGVDGSPVRRTRAVGGLALAVLAAVGMRSLAALDTPPSRARRVGAVLCLLGVGGAGAVTLWFARRAAPSPEAWSAVVPTLLPGVASIVVAAAICLALLRPGRPLRALLAVLVVTATVEAVVFASAFWSRPPADTFYRTTATHVFLEENLGQQRVASVGSALLPGSEVAYDIRSLTGHTFTSPRWNDVVECMDPGARLSPSTTRLSGPDVLDAPGLDRLAVRYVVTDPRVPPPGDDVTVGTPDTDGELLLAPGSSRLLPVPGVDLAGVYLDVVEAPAQDVVVTVTSYDEQRRVLGTTELPVPAGRAGRVADALPGVEATSSVSLSTDAPLRVRSAEQGGVWLGLVERTDGLRLAFSDGATVYENEGALDRYRWASSAVVEPSPEERALLVARTALPDATAVLDAPGPVLDGEPADVTIVAEDPDHRRLQVDAQGAGLLVVADALTDGWSATVDDEVVDLVTVDHALMGVPVPAGQHQVEITYRGTVPTAVHVLSGVAALLVLVWSGWALASRRRRRRGGAVEQPRGSTVAG